MATPHHLPKKRGALKSTPKISFFFRGTLKVSHRTHIWKLEKSISLAVWFWFQCFNISGYPSIFHGLNSIILLRSPLLANLNRKIFSFRSIFCTPLLVLHALRIIAVTTFLFTLLLANNLPTNHVLNNSTTAFSLALSLMGLLGQHSFSVLALSASTRSMFWFMASKIES